MLITDAVAILVEPGVETSGDLEVPGDAGSDGQRLDASSTPTTICCSRRSAPCRARAGCR
jgi:hypothetical protein